MTKKPEPLVPPAPPLKYRIPREGPSPREYELLEFQRVRELTEAETAELRAEQDTRTELEGAWAQYREESAAYERAIRSRNA